MFGGQERVTNTFNRYWAKPKSLSSLASNFSNRPVSPRTIALSLPICSLLNLVLAKVSECVHFRVLLFIPQITRCERRLMRRDVIGWRPGNLWMLPDPGFWRWCWKSRSRRCDGCGFTQEERLVWWVGQFNFDSFLGRARVSRIGLMESCTCHRCHCHAGPPSPTGWPPS